MLLIERKFRSFSNTTPAEPTDMVSVEKTCPNKNQVHVFSSRSVSNSGKEIRHRIIKIIIMYVVCGEARRFTQPCHTLAARNGDADAVALCWRAQDVVLHPSFPASVILCTCVPVCQFVCYVVQFMFSRESSKRCGVRIEPLASTRHKLRFISSHFIVCGRKIWNIIVGTILICLKTVCRKSHEFITVRSSYLFPHAKHPNSK